MRLYFRHDGPRGNGGSTSCGHEWAGANLPMERDALSLLLHGARCPACGGESGIIVTEAREMTISEALAGR